MKSHSKKRSLNKSITIKKDSLSKSDFIKLIFENYFNDNDENTNNNNFKEHNILTSFKLGDL